MTILVKVLRNCLSKEVEFKLRLQQCEESGHLNSLGESLEQGEQVPSPGRKSYASLPPSRSHLGGGGYGG